MWNSKFKQTYWSYFALNDIPREFLFYELTKGMDRLEEYADQETPYTERNNFQKEPIEEEITNNSS